MENENRKEIIPAEVIKKKIQKVIDKKLTEKHAQEVKRQIGYLAEVTSEMLEFAQPYHELDPNVFLLPEVLKLMESNGYFIVEKNGDVFLTVRKDI